MNIIITDGEKKYQFDFKAGSPINTNFDINIELYSRDAERFKSMMNDLSTRMFDIAIRLDCLEFTRKALFENGVLYVMGIGCEPMKLHFGYWKDH